MVFRMGWTRIFRCSPLRFVKFLIVCVSVIVLVVYFPRNSIYSDPKPHRADWADFVDSDDQLARDSRYKKISPVKHGQISVYAKKDVLRFNHSCDTRLKVGKISTPICVYHKSIDNGISSFVKDHGTWESELLSSMVSILDHNKNMQVVDLGCNIGVYSLVAAKMGRRVIAVDPLETNLQLLRRSLELGNIRRNVTLVHNSISNIPETVFIELRPGDIGGTHVKSVHTAAGQKPRDRPLKRVKRYKRLHHISKKKKSVVKRSSKLPNKPVIQPLPGLKKQKHNQKTHLKISNNINKFLPGVRVGPVIPRTFGKVPSKQEKRKMANEKHKQIKNLNKPKFHDHHNKHRKDKLLQKSSLDTSLKFIDKSEVLKQNKQKVQAVTLNDLVLLGAFKPTFLKIDIEGWEYLAFMDSSVFLRTFDVKYILMEWHYQREKYTGGKLIQQLVRSGFLPYKNNKGEVLDVKMWKTWPDKILWKKR